MGARIQGAAELLAMLNNAKREAPNGAKEVVKKGAQNIKTDWRGRWRGLSHAPSLASAVTYDITSSGYFVAAEIGPDKALRQGPLGNLLEFGSVNNAPHPGGAPALDAEEPRFNQAMEAMAAKLLGGA